MTLAMYTTATDNDGTVVKAKSRFARGRLSTKTLCVIEFLYQPENNVLNDANASHIS